MTTTMTPTERLSRMDQEVESLKQAFVDAAGQLAGAPEVDGSHDERWAAITKRLHDLRTELRPEDYDKDQLAEFYSTILDIRDLMDENCTLDTIDQLVINIERVRHVVRDALDEHVAGVADDVGLVVDELLGRLADITREVVGDLVGVDRRTLARWAKQSGTPTRRLATVARLVAILHHNWTPEGVVAWFYRPRRDLGGKKPITLLGDANFDADALISAARAGRSQYAS
jgi:uncharacterized protein (DUF2384 family)